MKLQLMSLRVIGCGPLQEDTLIDFCDANGKPRPITVLAGANGSGKTTVLELLLALSEILHPDYKYGPNNILDRTEYAQINWLVNNEKPFSIYYGQLPDQVNLPVDYKGLEVQTAGERIERYAGDIIEAITMAIPPTQKEHHLGFVYQQQRLDPLPSILYFPYYRSLRAVQGKQIQREEITYQWTYRYESASKFRGSLDSYLIWLDYAEPETYKHVIDFLNGLNLDGKTFGVQRRELKAIVTTQDGNTHEVNQLSSGEQNILITLLELRRRLVPHSLVLIDEIENSLHPTFQYRLAQGLRHLQAQIPFQLIVTTHAPAFVEIFGAENTLLLTEF